MNDKYLMAVVRIPVRVTSDGDLKLLNEYSKITIEKMNEILTRTNDTIYSKVVDYLNNVMQESKYDLSKYDLSNDDLSNDDLSNDDLSNDDLSNDDLSNDDLSNDDLSNDDLSNDDLSNDDLSNDDLSNDDLSNDDLSKVEEGPTEEEIPTVKEESAAEEVSTKVEERSKPIFYEFPYLKKSKKPINATFRARLKSQNFTKKVYGY
jgi:hypothetical protein